MQGLSPDHSSFSFSTQLMILHVSIIPCLGFLIWKVLNYLLVLYRNGFSWLCPYLSFFHPISFFRWRKGFLYGRKDTGKVFFFFLPWLKVFCVLFSAVCSTMLYLPLWQLFIAEQNFWRDQEQWLLDPFPDLHKLIYRLPLFTYSENFSPMCMALHLTRIVFHLWLYLFVTQRHENLLQLFTMYFSLECPKSFSVICKFCHCATCSLLWITYEYFKQRKSCTDSFGENCENWAFFLKYWNSYYSFPLIPDHFFFKMLKQVVCGLLFVVCFLNSSCTIEATTAFVLNFVYSFVWGLLVFWVWGFFEYWWSCEK